MLGRRQLIQADRTLGAGNATDERLQMHEVRRPIAIGELERTAGRDRDRSQLLEPAGGGGRVLARELGMGGQGSHRERLPGFRSAGQEPEDASLGDAVLGMLGSGLGERHFDPAVGRVGGDQALREQPLHRGSHLLRLESRARRDLRLVDCSAFEGGERFHLERMEAGAQSVELGRAIGRVRRGSGAGIRHQWIIREARPERNG